MRCYVVGRQDCQYGGDPPVVDLMESVQAGLEDFAYMRNIVDLNDLKRQIIVTGAEVTSFGQD